MLDIKYIRENPEEVIARLLTKGKDARADIEAILALDAERRTLITETETIKAEQNKMNKLIPQYKKEGKDVAPIFAEMKAMSTKTKEQLEEIYRLCGDRIQIAGAAATGYGEELIKEAFSLDEGLVETIAHYTAAKYFKPEVDFILDIGGQDIKSTFASGYFFLAMRAV